jgi:hypothetical protein
MEYQCSQVKIKLGHSSIIFYPLMEKETDDFLLV